MDQNSRKLIPAKINTIKVLNDTTTVDISKIRERYDVPLPQSQDTFPSSSAAQPFPYDIERLIIEVEVPLFVEHQHKVTPRPKH